jgi:hypothetical protein
MSMKNAFKASILFFGLAANVAHAESIADQVISQLTAQGYERIEIYNSPTEVRVEATKGGRVLEVVYDAVTGQILHQEVSSADQSDNEPNSDSGIDNSNDDNGNDDDVTGIDNSNDDDHEDASNSDDDHEDASNSIDDHEDDSNSDDDYEDDDNNDDDDHEDNDNSDDDDHEDNDSNDD